MESRIALQNQGEKNNFLYLFEKTRNPINPICNNKAVYLLLKAHPIAIPPKIQNHFFSSKIALYKQIKLNVQNNNSGTSGVELKDKIETKMVEPIKTSARCSFCSERKYEANL